MQTLRSKAIGLCDSALVPIGCRQSNLLSLSCDNLTFVVGLQRGFCGCRALHGGSSGLLRAGSFWQRGSRDGKELREVW